MFFKRSKEEKRKTETLISTTKLQTCLVHIKARVDASTIDFFALPIKPAGGWTHSVGADINHTHVLWEIVVH
jgi:hypothetical protein